MRFFQLIFIGLHTLSSASAADVKMTIPVFSQKLEVAYPNSYKVGPQDSHGNVFIMEMVPKTESPDSWSEMLTVSGYKGLAATQTAQSAMELETNSIKSACPKTFVFEKIDYKQSQNYPAALAIVGCSKHPTMAGKSELALQLVIQGKKDIYMIKKSFHRAVEAKEALSKLNYKKIASEVLSVQICKSDGQSPICNLEKNIK